MRVGTLNREITVKRKSTTLDSVYNTQVVTWVPLSVLPGSPEVAERFPAEVTDDAANRSTEGMVAGSLAVARNLTRIRMRWRSDIDSTMQVTIHGDTDRVMKIVSGPSEFGGRKVGIEFMCEEISS